MPLISVIVPVYNGAEYLDNALSSITSQDFTNIELICIDDASFDESSSILNAWASNDARIHNVRNERRQGAGLSRNVGLSVASGDYVLFVDCDDILSSGALSALVHCAEEDEVPLVRGNLREFSLNPNVTAAEVPQVPNKSRINFMALRQLWIPWFHTAWLINRVYVERTGARYPPLTLGEDPVFLAQLLASSSRISTVSHLCYEYRVGHKQVAIEAKDLHDFVAHASEVKRIFTTANQEHCWAEGYLQVAVNGTLYYLDCIKSGDLKPQMLLQAIRDTFCEGNQELLDLFESRIQSL